MANLSLENLLESNGRINLDQISIKLLAEYYEEYLMKYIYCFELENGVTIELKFSAKDFCHLIGIQQLSQNKYDLNKRKNRKKNINPFLYSGNRGFKRSKQGKCEFNHLKALHKSYYEKFENDMKCNFFHLIHKLLDSNNLKLVDFVELNDSKIKCDLIFHDEFDQALLHLGIEKEKNDDHYFPRTFFVRYLSKTNHDKFVEGRELFDIVTKEKKPTR